jgi:HlyD family secretion protein
MGMDKQIKKKFWTLKRISLSIAGALFLGLVTYGLLFADHRSKLRVDNEKLSIATVAKGAFQEFIPVSGTVLPNHTIYLDAIEGGIIKAINKESGELVEKGDTIMVLVNSNLQLNVMNREAQLYEQINNLRNTRLLLEQNSMTLQAQLTEINYRLQTLKPKYERQKALYEQDLVALQDFEEIREEYEYNLKRKALTYSSYKQDSILKIIQLSQLNDSEERMWKSLKAVNKILDNLNIQAPASGQLSTPELEIGQSLASGERLGQVDVLDSYKVRVAINELYLPRINKGQQGTFQFAGNVYVLAISKIYPTINGGRFEVDMQFAGQEPEGIKRGQSLRIRLELGNSAQALLLPTGGFYKETGGNWVFLVDESGDHAVKRNIRLGRKNPEYFEVLKGLKPGERVITSSYENFGDNEMLILN